MWKSDFQTLVPFVRSSEEEADSSFSFSKKDRPKKCTSRLIDTVRNERGTYIRNFYENVVNLEEEIIPAWNDSDSPVIQQRRRTNTITSGSLANDSSNYGNNNSACLKSKLDYYSASTKSEVASFSTSATPDKKHSTGFKHGDDYNKTDPNTVEKPSNCKPFFCQKTDVVKHFSHDHIRNSVLRCAQDGDLPGLKQHLKSGSLDIINCTDSFGWTPLMCASFAGHIDVVKFLLSLDGVDHRHRNPKGQSALGLSTKAGHWPIRKLLESHYVRVAAPSFSSSSSSYYKKEKRREKSILEEKLKDQSSLRFTSSSEYFCDVCQMKVRNTTKTAHESSTVHLLSSHPHPPPESYFLSEQNRGFQIMVRKGWDESKGLGPTGEGRRIPIKTILKRDRKGLGVKSSSSQVAKISHFDAGDTKAVTNKHSSRFENIKIKKKSWATIQRREKMKERRLRKCLDF